MKRILKGIQGPFAGAVFVLPERITIGRAGDSDIQILHPEVSRLHAKISLTREGRYAVRDLASDNGTYLNGRRISQASLRPGDELCVHRSIFVFEESDDPEVVTSSVFESRVRSFESMRPTLLMEPIEELRADTGPDRDVIVQDLHELGAEVADEVFVPSMTAVANDAPRPEARPEPPRREPPTLRSALDPADPDAASIPVRETFVQSRRLAAAPPSTGARPRGHLPPPSGEQPVVVRSAPRIATPWPAHAARLPEPEPGEAEDEGLPGSPIVPERVVEPVASSLEDPDVLFRDAVAWPEPAELEAVKEALPEVGFSDEPDDFAPGLVGAPWLDPTADVIEPRRVDEDARTARHETAELELAAPLPVDGSDDALPYAPNYEPPPSYRAPERRGRRVGRSLAWTPSGTLEGSERPIRSEDQTVDVHPASTLDAQVPGPGDSLEMELDQRVMAAESLARGLIPGAPQLASFEEEEEEATRKVRTRCAPRGCEAASEDEAPLELHDDDQALMVLGEVLEYRGLCTARLERGLTEPERDRLRSLSARLHQAVPAGNELVERRFRPPVGAVFVRVTHREGVLTRSQFSGVSEISASELHLAASDPSIRVGNALWLTFDLSELRMSSPSVVIKTHVLFVDLEAQRVAVALSGPTQYGHDAEALIRAST